MELKYGNRQECRWCNYVLIIPYGIEISKDGRDSLFDSGF